MKKIVSFLLVFALFTCMSGFVSAESTPIAVNDGGVKMTILTKDEYISRLSEIKEISKDEATKIVNSRNLGKDAVIQGGSQYYAEFYYQEDVGPGWAVEVGVLCLVASGSGHSNFVSVDTDAIWSNAIGSGPHTWDAFYKNATITNPSTLRLMTRGNLEIKIDASMTVDMKAGLISAGFTLSGTEYLRKTISISGTRNLG